MTGESLTAFLARVDSNEKAPQPPAPFGSRFLGDYDWKTRCAVTEDGVAIVHVHGTLIDRGAWLGTWWGMTSYEGLAEQLRRLGDDEDVKAILLDIDSGGGEVAGLFDVCATITETRRKKPIHAIASSMACSAAYAIGCAAQSLHVNSQGQVGSIGVISVHMSYAGMLDRSGIKPTLIHAGRWKALGNRYQDLSEEGLALLKANIDSVNDVFVAHVAKHRHISADTIRAFDARVFAGEEAVRLGLADGVARIEDLLTAVSTPARHRAHPRGHNMTNLAGPGVKPTAAADEQGILATIGSMFLRSQANASLPQASAAPAADSVTKAEAERMAKDAADKAVTATIDRFKTILGHDEAKGREAFALKLALSTGMTTEAAVEMLKEVPKATAAEAPKADDQKSKMGNALAAQMADAKNSAGVKPEAKPAASGDEVLKARLDRGFAVIDGMQPKRRGAKSE
jgi:signal peptide peptidase SppA